MFKAGDVIRLHDRWVRPPKPKWHVVISIEAQRFLRINSKNLFDAAHLLRASDCEFLHHDSFVELGAMVRHFPGEIDNAEYVGALTLSVLSELCLSVKTARTLSENDKSFILERLQPR